MQLRQEFTASIPDNLTDQKHALAVGLVNIMITPVNHARQSTAPRHKDQFSLVMSPYVAALLIAAPPEHASPLVQCGLAS